MNEQTRDLIEKLAAKLGTTTEHLWSVLVKQAPISATCDLILLILTVGIFIFCTPKLTLAIYNVENCEQKDEGKWITIIIISAIMILVTGIGGGCQLAGLPIIAAGFFNPEYWASHEVLHAH